jgi:two-component system response regulator FlrC
MQEVKKSLMRIVEKESRSDAHLLFQAADEAQAVEVARRIHEQSERAGQPFIVYDARQLLSVGHAKQVLDAFSKGALSPVEKVGGGTLVILHMEETPEDFQHVFAKILDVDFRGEGQRISGRAVLPLTARVILVEPPGDKTYTDIRRMCHFYSFDLCEDDL